MADRVIFHVDANSAFLSWTAAYRIKVLGETADLRDPATVSFLPSQHLRKNTESKQENPFFKHWKSVRICGSYRRIIHCM